MNLLEKLETIGMTVGDGTGLRLCPPQMTDANPRASANAR